ncbi:ATPase P [Desulfonatronospira sp.]|uniref:HAD family hydrolase n=1 Tax=Desulfonatronospira sp. TaxID=1962951 RepID=UPI0025BB22D5|nr:ATPase P [Desulfonatronospira sp.]
MLCIDIPGYAKIDLVHLLLDYNGTLALDGEILDGVLPRLQKLSTGLEIHVLTADTFGRAQDRLSGLECRFHLVGEEDQARAKAHYLEKTGAMNAAAVGNGRNDRLMLEKACLGIALIQEEGAALTALSAADVLCRDINHALDLLLHPLRLKATLRG